MTEENEWWNDKRFKEAMLLEGGDEVRVKWKGEWWDAEYLASYLKDSDLGLAILVMVIDDAPGLRQNDNLVCVPRKEGDWEGVYPI